MRAFQGQAAFRIRQNEKMESLCFGMVFIYHKRQRYRSRVLDRLGSISSRPVIFGQLKGGTGMDTARKWYDAHLEEYQKIAYILISA